MKSILHSVLRHIEKAIDSGLFISDDIEHALLLEELARLKDNPTDSEQMEETPYKAA